MEAGKDRYERVATILNVALQLSANLNIAFEPFLPFSSAKLRQMLQFDSVRWADFGKTELLPAGHALGKTELLFEQIDDAAIEQQINKLKNTLYPCKHVCIMALVIEIGSQV